MPKEILTIDKFDGMNPSMLTEGLVCIENARIDITPALVQEKADRAITGTIYVDSKTFTVNGVSHTVSVTTAGEIYVDSVSYGYMSGAAWQITVFGSVALIICTSHTIPAKIVTFGTNLDGAFRNVNVTTVSNDSIVAFGSLSDVKKFFVLNASIAVVLFGGALKPVFFALDAFTPTIGGVEIVAGSVIDCEEAPFEILDISPHFKATSPREYIDFLVYAYRNETGKLCFGKYDIAKCFTAGDTTAATAFDSDKASDSLISDTVTIDSVNTHDGYAFGAMAVTKTKVFFQMTNSNGEERLPWYEKYLSQTENEDFLFSFLLTEFSGAAIISDTDDWSGASVAGHVQKSCLPLFNCNTYRSDIPTHEVGFKLYMNTGIWVLNYAFDYVGVSVFQAVTVTSNPTATGFRCNVLLWNGDQPYKVTPGIAVEPVGYTMQNPQSPFGAETVLSRKYLDTSTTHNINLSTCYRNAYIVSGILDSASYTPYRASAKKRMVSSVVGWDGSNWTEAVFTSVDGTAAYALVPSIDVAFSTRGTNIFVYPMSTSYDTPVCTEVDIPSLTISAVPAFTDNYFYVFSDRSIKRVTSAYSASPFSLSLTCDPPQDSVSTGISVLGLSDEASPTGSFDGGYYRYAYSFIYDGYQESPLSTDRYDISVTAGNSVEVSVFISPSLLRVLPSRITGINIYCAKISEEGGDEEELYRLVRALQFSYNAFGRLVDGTFKASIADIGNRLGSFDAVAGYSETLKSVSVNRRVQCSCAGYMFVGGCDINAVKEKVNIDNIIIRSLPLQPSIYDYSRNFAVLPFTATAMTEYNNRLYVFGADEYAIVNPDTMAVELKSKTLGCSEPEQMVSTEYGLFVYYNGNVYNIEGLNVIPIGDSVKTSAFTTAGATYVPSIGALFNCKLSYVDRRDALILIGYDATTNSILSFMFSFATKRWMTYTITTTELYPLSVYDYEDTVALVMITDENVASAVRLFDGSTSRTVRVVANVSFGDPVPKKIVYGVHLNRDGAPGMTLLKDGVSTSFPDNLYTATYSVSYAGNIDWISFVYRVFVNKEHFFVPSIRVENPVGTDVYDLGEFITISGSPSATKSYYVGGFGFTSDLEVIPPAGFEISIDQLTWYGTEDGSIVIPKIDANDYMTKVYVRFVNSTSTTDDIMHSSGTVTKNLAVTGTVVELPHASDRLFDFQGDSGIIVSGTDVTNWESSIGTRVLDSDMSSNYKTPEIGSILNGIQSVRLGRKRDVYTYEYGSMTDGLLLGYYSSPLTFTIAGVFTVNNLSGTSIIMYPFCANYQPTAGLTCSAGHLYIGGTDIGIIAQGVPYSIVYTCDFVGNVLTYCLNSLEVVSVSYTTGNLSPLNYLPGGIGARTGLFTGGAIADIHAFIGWRTTTVFSESDYIRTMQYLMLKYGLT